MLQSIKHKGADPEKIRISFFWSLPLYRKQLSTFKCGKQSNIMEFYVIAQHRQKFAHRREICIGSAFEVWIFLRLINNRCCQSNTFILWERGVEGRGWCYPWFFRYFSFYTMEIICIPVKYFLLLKTHLIRIFYLRIL